MLAVVGIPCRNPSPASVGGTSSRSAESELLSVPCHLSPTSSEPDQFVLTCALKPKQAIDLDNERSIHESRKAFRHGVASVAINHEQLAAGLIFPSEACVGAERMGARVVLEECAHEHARRQGIGITTGHDGGREVTPRQRDPVGGDDRLYGELR